MDQPKEYPILVTAAVIEDNGKFLITQRPKDTHNANRWEFPGGKVKFKEDPRVGLEREIKEELGIKVKAKEILEYSSHVYDGKKHIVLLALHCTYLSGKIKKQEIQDYAWVSLEEMSNYDITEADIPFIEKLKKN
jgi:8-oxo-dGTP diphosphatase